MKLKKRIFFSFLGLLVASSAYSYTENDLDDDFYNASRGIVSGDLQNTFCYAKRDGENLGSMTVSGVNIDSPVRLASISKVVTTFWAISTLGPHYQFETQISWNSKNRHLHVAGSLDPFMGQQSLMFLVSELDRLGIHQIDSLSFDSKFIVFEEADIRSSYESIFGVQANPSPDDSQIALLKYFNTKNWSPNFMRLYALLRTKSRLANIKMVATPRLTVRNVTLNEDDETKYEAGALHFTYSSEELYKYLKHMNANSINYVANILFRTLGGTKAFEDFIHQKLRMRNNEIEMHTGSGLEFYTVDPVGRLGRVDNESTCESIVKVTAALDDELKIYGLSLPNVLLVAGVDQGTWGGTPTVNGSIAAKTGTLVEIPVANLAGIASTNGGNIYFGLFFQLRDLSDIGRARVAENSMVDRIVERNNGKNRTPLALGGESFLPFSSELR